MLTKKINYEKVAKKNILRASKEEAKGISIQGYDFDKGVDFSKIIDSYTSTGFQASKLAKAISIIKKMKKDGAFIYLGYTSNLVSSGLRDVFRYLAKHKLVDVIVTTAGGIEEDFVKCLGDFKLGEFELSGKILRDKGINRIGNILVPNSRYVKFEKFILPILARHKDETLSASKLIALLGKEINDERSIYYWCQKNNIPVYCPAITDGSLGDMIYFFKTRNPEFKVDVSADIVDMNNSTIGKRKTGIIVLGAGLVKHHICNANMFRNGTDYAVYINNAQEFDGSDAGARPDEAVSWGKISKEAESVKVFGDATILFPLIVGKAFF